MNCNLPLDTNHNKHFDSSVDRVDNHDFYETAKDDMKITVCKCGLILDQ